MSFGMRIDGGNNVRGAGRRTSTRTEGAPRRLAFAPYMAPKPAAPKPKPGAGAYANAANTQNIKPRITQSKVLLPGAIAAQNDGNYLGGPAPAAAPAPSLSSGGSMSGGGGGGAGGGAAGGPAAPTMTLEDFIANHFLKKQTENENERALEDFDAETLRLTQETEADQEQRELDLQRNLDEMGRGNAESFASRGLGRSGLVFQAQDDINEEGVRRQAAIDDLLTSLTTNRGQGRIAQQRAGEKTWNERVAQITQEFNQRNQQPLNV